MDTQEGVLQRVRKYRETVGRTVRWRTGELVKVPISWWGTLAITSPLEGNRVVPLVDGEVYANDLYDELQNANHYVLVTDFVITADFRLRRAAGSSQAKSEQVSLKQIVGQLAKRSVQVRIVLWGLSSSKGVWQVSNPVLLQKHVMTLREQLALLAAGGKYCRIAIYSQSRFGTALHQKTIVIDGRVAYCGGIDLAYDDDGDRWDSREHRTGDKRRASGSINWHDVQVKVEGPAVRGIQENFVRRWRLETGGDLGFKVRNDQAKGEPPMVRAQVIRTIPSQPRFEYGQPQDSPDYSTIESWAKAIINARSLIYIENQYFFVDLLLVSWQSV